MSLYVHLGQTGGIERLNHKLNPGGDNLRKLEDVEHYIDYAEVVEIKQLNGITNYTYRISLPEANESLFYNIVMKKDNTSGKSKTVLIKYSMNSSFATDYYGLKTNFSNFTGTLGFETLSVDEGYPCEEEPTIPIPVQGGGGSGSGGSSGGGGGGGGSNGGGYGYTYNQNLVNAQYLALSISTPEDDPLGNDDGSGNNGDDDEVWYEVSRSPRGYGIMSVPNVGPAITDPCGEGQDIGILPPNPAQQIENKITYDNLDECSKDIVDDLKKLEQQDIAEIIDKFDPEAAIYTVDIKTVPEIVDVNGNNVPGQTVWNASFDYTIKISEDQTINSTKLYRASVILHELIHAYFFSLVDDQSNNIDTDALDDFPLLFEAYVEHAGQGGAMAQHKIMAEKYVDIIARALQEYNTGIAVPENQTPAQAYTDLAWAGLRDCPVYYSDLLTNDDRARIEYRNASEALNLEYGGQTPLGSTCE